MSLAKETAPVDVTPSDFVILAPLMALGTDPKL